MDIGKQLLLQAFLIFLNAFFAMTEIAVISLNQTKLKKMAEDGDRSAPKLLKMVEEPSGFLSTIQVGITLAGFLGSAFAADSFSGMLVNWVYNDLGWTAIPEHVLSTLAVIVITIILSYFTLVFGELVPKRIAMQKPLEAAKISCGVISGMAVVMRPVIWFLSFSTNTVLKLLRLKTENEEDTVTEEEIRMMVDLGQERGTIDSNEGEWIENVFDFGETTVREVMTHVSDLVAIQEEDTPAEVLKIIRESGRSRIPVYGKSLDDILGILSTREFLLNRCEEWDRIPPELIRPAYFVPETLLAATLLKDMQRKKNHIAVVIDEYGQTCGVATMEDLLEEIVGNIYDEYDPEEEQPITKLGDNLWRASGLTEVDDLEEALDMEFPEDVDFDTLNGLVFSQINYIPDDGAKLDVEACGLKVHVDRIARRRVVSATISKVEKPEEEEEE